MFSIRSVSGVVLLFAAFSPGRGQAPQRSTIPQEPVRAEAGSAFVATQASLPQSESPAPNTQQVSQTATHPSGEPEFQDVEERKGPFTFGGQTYTVVAHNKRVSGKQGEGALALASLDITDAAGAVLHHEEFPHSFENGEFTESCSVSVNPITGSNGAGLLLDTGCLPSAPLSGGPWQIFGIVNGKLSAIGKPLYAEGEMGDFVPGKVNHMGNLTQILPDELRIRLFTGYFFVSVPVRVNWMERKLALAQHCFYQTGHGMAEGGCEMPVEGVERHPGEQDLTFVRMFPESNEQIGPPAHVVVKKDSRVEILAGKVLVTWEEGKDGISLGIADDIWVKVRIDGKEGWIHSDEDLQAIGLYRAG
ncbi:MAG: hypothetical protein WCB14_11785 [Candidatus Acidiferrales bacterium]